MVVLIIKASCLRYCKSTIFQANHNKQHKGERVIAVVCDTAKVRFFKQITTYLSSSSEENGLFAILQKYDFSSKSQLWHTLLACSLCCLRYCKSTIFQANHNRRALSTIITSLFAILQKYDFSSKSQQGVPYKSVLLVVCDTAKVRFFKQITTIRVTELLTLGLFAILQKYDFSSKSQLAS